MNALFVLLPIMMTISIIVSAWSSGYGTVVDVRMFAPLAVVFIGSFNLLLTIRSNYLRRKLSRF
jgi:hypothetical protein